MRVEYLLFTRIALLNRKKRLGHPAKAGLSRLFGHFMSTFCCRQSYNIQEQALCEWMEAMAGPQSTAFEGEKSLSEPGIYVALTYEPLNATVSMARVKSAKAGAVVLFAGKDTTPRQNAFGLTIKASG